MTRRVISLGLCLGLVALGPATLSVCAMMMSLPGECAPPAAQENCEGMQHAEEPVAMSAGDDSCCRIAAPAPDAVTLSKDAPVPQLSSSIASPVAELASAERSRIEFSTAATPSIVCPPGQARLCVFLI